MKSELECIQELNIIANVLSKIQGEKEQNFQEKK